MTLDFPSQAFDEAVAAVCHGTFSEAQASALNTLLRHNQSAQDEFIRRLELHSRLASAPDLFTAESFETNRPPILPEAFKGIRVQPTRTRPFPGINLRHYPVLIALAACLVFLLAGWWGWKTWLSGERNSGPGNAVALLNRVVDAEWTHDSPHSGSPLQPGKFHLEAGLAQIVFYSGARVVIQGPADIELISPREATLRTGRLTAEIPPQAQGFRVNTPKMEVIDLGTSFGLAVDRHSTELHVFKGSVEWMQPMNQTKNDLQEGSGAILHNADAPRFITANPTAFEALFDLQSRSLAADALRYDQWREASARLKNDPSLLLHLDFEKGSNSDWRLPNTCNSNVNVPDATIIGGHWTNGRWKDKRALEFQSVSDRIRLTVPGKYKALTLATWVRVQGLDRKINSLFMSDGFEAGTVHWVIRNDGVLGLTAIGSQVGDFQISTTSPVLTLDQFGMWIHLAVVLDGKSRKISHYVNGKLVRESTLKIDPPFQIGASELGNWNAIDFKKDDPFHIRNFSGAMDEFLLYSRALNPKEIRSLHALGNPQAEPSALKHQTQP